MPNGNDCDKCFDCQRCISVQDSGCIDCFDCQKCFTAQDQNCDKCFDCQKCFTGQEGEFSAEGQALSITYFVFPTNECNLRCKYCYATKNPARMDEEGRKQLLRFIFEIEEKRVPGRQISIQFFGGEPMLMWSWITKFIEDAEKLADEVLKRKIRFGMTTNGTLLNEERLKFMKAHNMMPLISVDGRRETHNKYRVTKEGKGSWDLIPFDLYLKYYPNPEIRPTIMPDTIETWLDDLAWFHSKNCYIVATEVAYEADWNDEAMEKARIMYNKMGDMYIDFKKKGQKCWMKFIDDGKMFLGHREQRGYICGVARSSLGINARGELYACQRYASFNDKNLSLGNIWDGLDMEKLKWWNDMKREYMHPDPKSGFDCETCPARWRCRGGCNAMNQQVCGDRKIVLETHCKFQRLWAEISLRVLSATGELWDGIPGQNKCNVYIPQRNKV